MKDIKALLEQARNQPASGEGIGYQSDRSEGPHGIRIPNSTQVPNEILDNYLSQLTGAELKVLLYLVRKTFGYNKLDGDDISLSQLEHGTKSRAGEAIDTGTGLDKKSILRATQILESVGLIEVTRKENREGRNLPNHYRLKIEEIKG
jgi:hypothetical protein